MQITKVLSTERLDRLIKWVLVLLVVSVVSYGLYYYLDIYRPHFGPAEEQSIASARQTVELSPQNIAARNQLAILYIDNKNYDAAIAEMDEVLKAVPGHSRALTIQGLAFLRKGDPDSALERFEKVIDATASVKYGDYSQDLNNSAYFGGTILFDRGQFDKAAKYFQRSLVLDSSDADAHMYLGRSLYEQGQYDGAVSELGIASSFMPEEAEYHYHYALALQNNGQVDQAKQELEQALKYKSNYKEAADALKQMVGK